MKRLFTILMTMLLGTGLALAQATGGSTDKAGKVAGTGRKGQTRTSGRHHKESGRHHKGRHATTGSAAGETGTPPPK